VYIPRTFTLFKKNHDKNKASEKQRMCTWNSIISTRRNKKDLKMDKQWQDDIVSVWIDACVVYTSFPRTKALFVI